MPAFAKDVTNRPVNHDIIMEIDHFNINESATDNSKKSVSIFQLLHEYNKYKRIN